MTFDLILSDLETKTGLRCHQGIKNEVSMRFFFRTYCPFEGTTACPYFGLRVTLSLGFKARVASALFAISGSGRNVRCLRVTSDAITAPQQDTNPRPRARGAKFKKKIDAEFQNELYVIYQKTSITPNVQMSLNSLPFVHKDHTSIRGVLRTVSEVFSSGHS